MPSPLTVTFKAGSAGTWRIQGIAPVVGQSLAPAAWLSMSVEPAPQTDSEHDRTWQLRGVISNPRYTTAGELKELVAVQDPLGRQAAVCAALIPIRKSEAWWTLAQDERRAVFEDSSQHIARSMKFLPAIARRLHHSRDLGEPFDFLTWFEYLPEHTQMFEDLVGELRSTEEWRYVEREVDVRLSRA